jgi:hypothetical protein
MLGESLLSSEKWLALLLSAVSIREMPLLRILPISCILLWEEVGIFELLI